VLADALGRIRDHCNTFSDNQNAAGMRGTATVALASVSDRAKLMQDVMEAADALEAFVSRRDDGARVAADIALDRLQEQARRMSALYKAVRAMREGA